MIQRMIVISVLILFIALIGYAGFFIMKQTNGSPAVIYESQPHKNGTDLSENQEPKNPGTSVATEKEINSNLWDGEWNRNIQFNQGTLLIKNVTDSSFSFELSTLHGGNMGELTGTAS